MPALQPASVWAVQAPPAATCLRQLCILRNRQQVVALRAGGRWVAAADRSGQGGIRCRRRAHTTHTRRRGGKHGTPRLLCSARPSCPSSCPPPRHHPPAGARSCVLPRPTAGPATAHLKGLQESRALPPGSGAIGGSVAMLGLQRRVAAAAQRGAHGCWLAKRAPRLTRPPRHWQAAAATRPGEMPARLAPSMGVLSLLLGRQLPHPPA